MQKFYEEHQGKVIEANGNCKHVMAITLDPRTGYKAGIVRCIVSREGDVAVKGFLDRSELHTISGSTLEQFTIGEKLNIQHEKEIIEELSLDGDFIGLEDPDIWIDERTDIMHVYFTMPIIPKDKDEKIRIHLGHAMGKDLDSLEMTMPVLLSDEKQSAKEVSIAPENKKGFRYNLIESRDRQEGITYSTVQVAIVENMGASWQYGEIAFHPKDHNLSWIAGHASPGPLFSETFIDVGSGKRLGVLNGREADQKIDGKIKYGTFSVGLFLYNYEEGKIEWVSPEPFIQDREAKTITFASQFVETKNGEGILYAHVDDSFVRAYTLKADLIKPLLPNF